MSVDQYLLKGVERQNFLNRMSFGLKFSSLFCLSKSGVNASSQFSLPGLSEV